MNAPEFFFLRSKRIGFRTWNEQDINLAMKLWGDFQVTKLFDGRGPLSLEQVRSRLKSEIETQQKHGIQYWPIFSLEFDKFIGCAGLRPYNISLNIYETGFHICSEEWRKGYAFEAARAVIEHAFTTLKAEALFAGHNPENVASKSLLTKLGFKYTHDEFYEPTGLMHPSYLLKAKQVR